MVGDFNKLRKLRLGIPEHQNVTLGNGDNAVTVAVVALSADIMQQLDEQVEGYCQKNADKVNDDVRTQYYNRLLTYYCMRDPEDPTLQTMMAESADEVAEIMDIEDISRICNAYGDLMMNKAPKIEIISEEQLELIKKHLEVTPLSDLSTVLLVHLGSCHQAIISEI